MHFKTPFIIVVMSNVIKSLNKYMTQSINKYMRQKYTLILVVTSVPIFGGLLHKLSCKQG